MQAWLQRSLAQRPFQDVLEISDDEEITKEPSSEGIVSEEIIAQLIQEYLKFWFKCSCILKFHFDI